MLAGALTAPIFLAGCDQGTANQDTPTHPTAAGTTSANAPTGQAAPSGGYINSVGMEFVRIPAGRFLMGWDDNDPEATEAEKPQHEVTISKAFDLGVSR